MPQSALQPDAHPPDALLDEIVRRIVAAVHPQRIILFGSAGRGTMGPDSDLDLLVITPCTHRRATARAARRQLIGIPVPIDLIVATPEDIDTYKSSVGLVYRSALRDGRVVYAA